MDELPTLTVSPIGFVRTGMASKFDAPHQPDRGSKETSTIELLPQREFDKALLDLEGFEYIWLIWWFHRNRTWRPKVQPPRGDRTKRGVFATRAPHRPNPIGITVVPLLGVSGLTLTIGSCDLVDGTPIFDIKPYIPSADSFPEAKIGWLQEIEDNYSAPPAFTVSMSALAQEQVAWLAEHSINFIERAITILRRDPSENRSRRITRHNSELFRMGCAEWRIFFSLRDSEVSIEFIQPGYPTDRLRNEIYKNIPNRQIQLEFLERWQRSEVD